MNERDGHLRAAVSPGKITLAIDRVTLDGVALSPGQTERLRRQLGGELARLLRQRGEAGRFLPADIDRLQLSADIPGESRGPDLAAELARVISLALAGPGNRGEDRARPVTPRSIGGRPDHGMGKPGRQSSSAGGHTARRSQDA